MDPEYKLNTNNNPFGDISVVENIINKVFINANNKMKTPWFPLVHMHNLYHFYIAVSHKSFLAEQNHILDPRNGYIFPTSLERHHLPKLNILCTLKPDYTYERLEVIGDSVIGLIVMDFLYERFPDKNENFMTVVKSRLVEKEMLAHFARCVGLVPFILISSFHEHLSEKNQGRNHQSIQEDVFEAFVGAIYKDYVDAGKRGLGYEIATNFVRAVIELYADLDGILSHNKNFKNSFIMYFQNQRFSNSSNGNGNAKITFIQAFTEGPSNMREFAMCVLVPKTFVSLEGMELPSADYHAKTISLLQQTLLSKKENHDLCSQIKKNILAFPNLKDHFIVGFGHAKTKRQAEQNAARDGLLTLGIDVNYGYLQ
jgi:dsRNA-specific ribonuclease